MNALHHAASTGEGPAWGAWIKLSAVESTEILARAGFDFAIVDLEHTLLDLNTASAHVMVGQALGMRMFVRVPDLTQSLIQRLLDGGADGIVAPHINDAEAAAHLVGGTRFPPVGVRGSGATSRAGGWGRFSRSDYMSRTGTAIGQIESVAAVDNVEHIAGVEGMGALMLGPADLGIDSAARPGSPQVAVQAARVRQAARARGVLVGTAVGAGTAAVSRAHGEGYDFIVCGSDVTTLAAGAAEVMAMAGQLPRTVGSEHEEQLS